MALVERRQFERKAIRMACVVQFSSGASIEGNTVDISFSGVAIESSSLAGSFQGRISPGDGGLLTLKFKKGAVTGVLKARCQVMHLLANGMGLSVRFADMNRREQDWLGEMLDSGKPEVH